MKGCDEVEAEGDKGDFADEGELGRLLPDDVEEREADRDWGLDMVV